MPTLNNFRKATFQEEIVNSWIQTQYFSLAGGSLQTTTIANYKKKYFKSEAGSLYSPLSMFKLVVYTPVLESLNLSFSPALH